MDTAGEPPCPSITECTFPTDVLHFCRKSCYYMKRLDFPCSSSTDTKKMPVRDFLLSAIFQVVIDKLASGLILAFSPWDRIQKKLEDWSQRLSIQGQDIKDHAGENKQWLRLAMDLARGMTDLLDEMALFQGSEDHKETTRKILAYEYLPASTYATQEEEDDIQLPCMYRGKSNKWKQKHPPRKLYRGNKWKKKHPAKHTKNVPTGNTSEEGITRLSASTEEDDRFIYSLLDTKECYEEETPAQTHEHIHKEQSSPLHKGNEVKTSTELNIEPSTSATPDSSALGEITELQTNMDRRFVELKKLLHQVLDCIEIQDTSPICAQVHKRRRATKLPPAKRQRTQGPEVAKYVSNTSPVCKVPSTPVVDTPSNTPTLFFCSFLL